MLLPGRNVPSGEQFDWALEPASASASDLAAGVYRGSTNYEIYLHGSRLLAPENDELNIMEFMYAKFAELVLGTEDQEIAGESRSMSAHAWGESGIEYSSSKCQHLASEEPVLSIHYTGKWAKFLTNFNEPVCSHEMHYIQEYWDARK